MRVVFSYVYEVSVIDNDAGVRSRMALKRILLSNDADADGDDDCVTRSKREIGVHQSFSSVPTLMPIVAHKFCKEGKHRYCYMVFPLISSSLREEVNQRLCLLDNENSSHRRRPFSDVEILEIFAGIVDGVEALHEGGLAHRDIKLENVLFDNDDKVNSSTGGMPILMDFGSVTPAKVPIRSRQSLLTLVDEAATNSTVSYRAPELFEGHLRYSATDDKDDDEFVDGRVDIWSLGCVLFAMMFGYSPFECEIHGDRIKVVDCSYLRVLSSIPRPNPYSSFRSMYSDDLFDLVVWMLNHDRLERPTIAEVSKKTDDLLKVHGGVRRWKV